MFKKLFKIFGPIIFALLIIFLLLISPFNYGLKKVSNDDQKKAAVSLDHKIIKGKRIKEQALGQNDYVAFFGSSEWSRFDPMHPAVLAEKYNRNYRPFLLGAKGTQSLVHFLNMQTITNNLKNKKAVYSISPQWFVPKGIRKDAFNFYYSPLEATEWLLNESQTPKDQYIAKRFSQLLDPNSDHVLHQTFTRIENGKKPTKFQLLYIKMRHQLLLNEDRLFSSIYISNRNENKIKVCTKQLPPTYDYNKIYDLAGELGKQNTSNNRFGISDKFYRKQIAKKVKRFKGFQAKEKFTKSPEYADFQAVLETFAKNNTDVIFVLPPVNQQWQKYTGLSQQEIQNAVTKIKFQLKSQGFNHIVDLSNNGDIPFFMTDTIHLGWRGWLYFDSAVGPFLENHHRPPHYQLNNHFYDRKWQQATVDQIVNFK